MSKLITENFELVIDKTTVKCVHKGFKLLDTEDYTILQGFIKLDLNLGHTMGCYPYNNFECVVDWKL